MNTELALYEHAREALASAVSFDEVTQIKTRAEQAKAYARIAKDRKLLADAQELIARAERKLGIMLRQVKDDGLLSQGGRPAERSNVSEPETGADAEPVFDATPFTLAELGISKKLSMRAQQLAELDDDIFENSVTTTREKILATDAAVVSAPKVIKVTTTPKMDPIKPLPADVFHRFTFSVLALTMHSDRVSSEALQLLAEHCRIVVLEGEAIDFTPEAIEALGHLAEVALKALDGEQQNTPATANEAPKAVGDGGDASTDHPSEPVGTTLPGGSPADPLDEGRQPPAEPISTEAADAVIRAGYAAEPPTPVADLAIAIGRPGNRNYVKNRARVMGLSSRERQREIASAFTTAQHAARREGTA